MCCLHDAADAEMFLGVREKINIIQRISDVKDLCRERADRFLDRLKKSTLIKAATGSTARAASTVSPHSPAAPAEENSLATAMKSLLKASFSAG